MKKASRGEKTICIPVASEAVYRELVEDANQFRVYLDGQLEQHPELFPPEMVQGYRCYGMTRSQKLNLKLRRIQIVSSGAVYQLRPDFVMPYLVGKTDDVEKALYLRRYGVPYEALAYAFGRDAMYWYRAERSLGKFSVVGTTVKGATELPVHLAADEKHTWLEGERVYVPTTVAGGCILGVEIVSSASTEALQQGYQVFQTEALNFNPSYCPQTVNTDGWQETQMAWERLFTGITVVLCFLHSVLGIPQHLRRQPSMVEQVRKKLWHLYRASDKAQFAQRLRRLIAWATPKQIESELVRIKIANLRTKAPKFKLAYDFPGAHRTSSALVRWMNHQDRYLYAMQYFHGTFEAARLQLRAMALTWNFHPYTSRTRLHHPERSSPFGELNGFVYHPNWLHNLLIAGSMNGYIPRDKAINKIS
jgi:hypothetical protein